MFYNVDIQVGEFLNEEDKQHPQGRGFIASSAHAQGVTLSSASASPGGATDMVSKYQAEIAAANNIATIQVQVGQVLTKTMLQVAQGKTDMSAAANILYFLMSKGLGPYSGLGKEKGKHWLEVSSDDSTLIHYGPLSALYLFSLRALIATLN